MKQYTLIAIAFAATELTAQRPEVELSDLPAGFRVENQIEYTSLGNALRDGYLDLHITNALDLPAETGALVAGLDLVLQSRNEVALGLWDSLAANGSEEIVSIATGFAAQIRYDMGKWDRVAALFGDGPGGALMRVLATLPQQQLGAGEAVSTHLELGSQRGQPATGVSVNGNSDVWWFDTGAAFTSVSASVAEEMGIRVVDSEPIGISTATTLVVPARVGLIDELRLGEVIVNNHPVLVFPDSAMSFELPEGDSLVLRGIIGWNVIRYLKAELDYAGGSYTARLSTPYYYGTRNFSWIGYPFVRLADETGQPLLFGLDTGSGNTSIAPSLLDKLTFDDVRQDTVPIGGIGGMVETEVQIVDEFVLALTGVRIKVPEIRTETTSGAEDVFFFNADGVLGSDIARDGKLTLDYLNGYIELEREM